MKKKVLILFGGESSEHEVSRVSAMNVIDNIDREKFEVFTVGIHKNGLWSFYSGSSEKIGNGDWEKDVLVSCSLCRCQKGQGLSLFRKEEQVIINIDVVFPVLHGKNGEDGTMQGMLEIMGIPYVGPGSLSSAICMDKAATKKMLMGENIKQADFEVFRSYQSMDHIIDKILKRFKFPVFVKPSSTGSSVGINKAHNEVELEKSINEAFEHGDKILVEEFVEGLEVECGILGNNEIETSKIGQIISANEFYDYEAKYDKDSKLIVDPDLPSEVKSKIYETSKRIFSLLGLRGMSRVDYFVDKDNNLVFNEINTIPGFTKKSMYPMLFESKGYSYKDLITKLITLALEK